MRPARSGPQAGPTATHVYAAAGDWTATVTVTDQSGGTATASASVSVTPPVVNGLDRRVAASADDAEEPSGARPKLTDNALDLAYNSGSQTVGMRFTGLSIPPHAFITAAYVQFTARGSRTEAASLTI